MGPLLELFVTSLNAICLLVALTGQLRAQVHDRIKKHVDSVEASVIDP